VSEGALDSRRSTDRGLSRLEDDDSVASGLPLADVDTDDVAHLDCLGVDATDHPGDGDGSEVDDGGDVGSVLLEGWRRDVDGGVGRYLARVWQRFLDQIA